MAPGSPSFLWLKGCCVDSVALSLPRMVLQVQLHCSNGIVNDLCLGVLATLKSDWPELTPLADNTTVYLPLVKNKVLRSPGPSTASGRRASRGRRLRIKVDAGPEDVHICTKTAFIHRERALPDDFLNLRLGHANNSTPPLHRQSVGDDVVRRVNEAENLRISDSSSNTSFIDDLISWALERNQPRQES
eukprot:3718227-Amphidinium_carterae.1